MNRRPRESELVQRIMRAAAEVERNLDALKKTGATYENHAQLRETADHLESTLTTLNRQRGTK